MRLGLVALAMGAALLALPLMGCDNNVGDQICTPDSVPTDEEDDCPFGPPGGPKVTEQGDCEIKQKTDQSKCDTTWTGEIFQLLTTDAVSGNCSLGNCHGTSPGAGGIFLDIDNAGAAYDQLAAYLGAPNYPYINTENREHSWILCNLKGKEGGGKGMPTAAGLDPDPLAIVEDWAACGLKR